MFFLRFLRCSRNPLRESAWSRCKNSRFFATFVVRTGPRELSRGSRACSRNRRVAGSIPPWSAGGRRKMQLAFYSNLRRPTCTDQFAQSALPRATCAEQLTQLAQSSLHRATCRERNLHRATCRDQLAGATCAEQLAQSNLHSVEQLAQTNLHRPVCAEHLAWRCLPLASRSVGKKNASCSVGPTSLAMFCFRANRGLVSVAGDADLTALKTSANVRPRQLSLKKNFACAAGASKAGVVVQSVRWLASLLRVTFHIAKYKVDEGSSCREAGREAQIQARDDSIRGASACCPPHARRGASN